MSVPKKVKAAEAKPRKFPFTPEQNQLLVAVKQQMRDTLTRQQAILDTIAATNKVSGKMKLNETKPGEFELEEVVEADSKEKV